MIKCWGAFGCQIITLRMGGGYLNNILAYLLLETMKLELHNRIEINVIILYYMPTCTVVIILLIIITELIKSRRAVMITSCCTCITRPVTGMTMVAEL